MALLQAREHEAHDDAAEDDQHDEDEAPGVGESERFRGFGARNYRARRKETYQKYHDVKM